MDEDTEAWRQKTLAQIREVRRVCEESLFDPLNRGVIVIEDQYGNPISAELSDAVQYGTVLLMKQR